MAVKTRTRAAGEGTIYENKKAGRWEGQVSYTDPSTGRIKRKKLTGAGQKEVATKVKAFARSLEDGLLPEADRITVWDWLERWLTDYIKPNVRAKTFEKYESCLKSYIKPTLGEVSLAKLKAPNIQRVFNNMLTTGGRARTGVSTSTVRATRRYLSMAFNKAIQVGVLTKNIVKATDPPRLVKEEIHPLTEDQADRLLKVAKAGEYIYFGIKQKRKPSPNSEYLKAMSYMAVSLALSTGMRLGEVFGLKWVDIDFAANSINIQRALVSSTKQGMIFEDTKTKSSKRRLPVTVQVKKALERYQIEQKLFANMMGDKFDNKEGLVFANIAGNPVDTSNFTKRVFKRMLGQANLDRGFSFHDLRHTHATLLLKQGVNIKVISERLGHSTVTMTLDTYSHLMPDMQETAVKALEGIFNIR